MAKGKKKSSAGVDRVAEAVGHALGSVAGTIDSLKAQHPHPVDEVREALVAGQETLAGVAFEAGTRAATVLKKAKAVARRTKKVATRAGRKSTRVAARVSRTARSTVKRARKAVKRTGRKTVKRAARRPKR
jgi:transaldolase